MRPGETDTAGRKWSAAPSQIGPMTTGSIQGVWLSPGQDVDWTWSADGNVLIVNAGIVEVVVDTGAI